MLSGMARIRSDAAIHIGAIIADKRKERGLTQDQLAAKTMIESSNIRSYESGRSLPGIRSVVRLADGLEIEPGELVDGLTIDMFPPTESDGRRGPR